MLIVKNLCRYEELDDNYYGDYNVRQLIILIDFKKKQEVTIHMSIDTTGEGIPLYKHAVHMSNHSYHALRQQKTKFRYQIRQYPPQSFLR